MFPFDPLKTSEFQRFSDVFRGIKKEHWKKKVEETRRENNLDPVFRTKDTS